VSALYRANTRFAPTMDFPKQCQAEAQVIIHIKKEYTESQFRGIFL